MPGRFKASALFIRYYYTGELKLTWEKCIGLYKMELALSTAKECINIYWQSALLLQHAFTMVDWDLTAQSLQTTDMSVLYLSFASHQHSVCDDTFYTTCIWLHLLIGMWWGLPVVWHLWATAAIKRPLCETLQQTNKPGHFSHILSPFLWPQKWIFWTTPYLWWLN